MSKTKLSYACSACGATTNKWSGQCPDCSQWNSLTEVIAVSTKATARYQNYAGITTATSITLLEEIPITKEARIASGLSELDRVLGGGLVSGSVILIGGDPGIGKSTVLLQTISFLSRSHKTLYITGEESLQQVKLRATRLGLVDLAIPFLLETQIEAILLAATKEQPVFMVIDSIQTTHTDLIQSAPGSVSQVRETTAQLVRFAKQTGTTLFLIGHVTKEGAIAGPRVLEHMVDTVLYFEGAADNRFRVIRAVKNRFGAVNELGIFAMTDKGLREINNPSAIFLCQATEAAPGSVVMVTWEGSRPMLVEIQALLAESHLEKPKRVTVGLDQNRLALILAVLHRHGGIVTYSNDVFVNVVGGVRVTETGIDLPAMLAVYASLKNQALPKDMVVFGEVGLSGEIRPVQSGQERLKEAVKLGFKQAIVPKHNAPKTNIAGLEVKSVATVAEAIEYV